MTIIISLQRHVLNNRMNCTQVSKIKLNATIFFKDTSSAFSSTHKVQAGRDNMGDLSAPGQSLHYSHLVKVVRCLQTVLVELKLRTKLIDFLTTCNCKHSEMATSKQRFSASET